MKNVLKISLVLFALGLLLLMLAPVLKTLPESYIDIISIIILSLIIIPIIIIFCVIIIYGSKWYERIRETSSIYGNKKDQE